MTRACFEPRSFFFSGSVMAGCGGFAALAPSAVDLGERFFEDFCIGILHSVYGGVVVAKRQVACGKNGTRGAILGKRRLLGERILAVAGIWRSDDIDEVPRSEIND
jgi:hypothetical protein